MALHETQTSRNTKGGDKIDINFQFVGIRQKSVTVNFSVSYKEIQDNRSTVRLSNLVPSEEKSYVLELNNFFQQQIWNSLKSITVAEHVLSCKCHGWRLFTLN